MVHGPLPNGAGDAEPEIPPLISAAEYISAVDKEIAPKFKSKFGGREAHEFCSERPVRRWVVKNAILAGTLVLFVGKPGSGKSFLALDLAKQRSLAVVDDRVPCEWFGRKIKPGGTIYIAAEGQDDFVIRMHSAMISRGLPANLPHPFFLIPSPIDLRTSEANVTNLIAEIKAVSAVFREKYGVEVDMVFVDTLNRALAGGDDSKPEHIGAFITNCGLIRQATGVTMIPVCHQAKATMGMDPRGHGSITGDNDGEIFVAGAIGGAPNGWVLKRNKAGPAGDRHEFRLRQVVVGRDDEGEDVTSCYVVAGAHEPSLEGVEMKDAALAEKIKSATMTADGRSILGPNLTMVMRALHEGIERIGEDAPPLVPAPHGRKVIKFAAWTDEIVRLMPGDDKQSVKFKDRCRKMRDAGTLQLRNRGVIGIHEEYIWRTSKRIAMIDRAANAEPEPADAPLDDPNAVPF